jgi:O-antigen/teichoic acid export membrane protein
VVWLEESELVETTIYKVISEMFNKLFLLFMLPVIIRLLPRDEIGVIGIVAGYVAIIAVGNVCPENILIRNFFKVRYRHFKLSSYLNFSLVKFGLMAAATLVITLFMPTPTLRTAMFLQAGIIFFGGLTAFFNFIYYVQLKQKFVTAIQIVSQLVGIGVAFYLMMAHQSVIFYYTGLLVVSLMTVAFFLAVVGKEFDYAGFRVDMQRQKEIIITSLTEFSFWNYLTGFVTNIMYTISPAILSIFAGMGDVGNLTICVLITDFYFIVPMIVQGTGTIALSNLRKRSLVHHLMRYQLMISLVTLLGFLMLGNPVLLWLSGREEYLVYASTFIMMVFATPLNTVRPMLSKIVARYDMKNAFVKLFLPTLIFNVGSLVVLSSAYGFQGAVWGNSLSYLFFATMIVLFYRFGD